VTRGRRTSRGGQRGVSVVEFALVFCFVVFPLMLGIIQYGYHYWALETASATAREAARRMAVGTQEACTTTEAVERLRGPAVGSSSPTAQVGYPTTRAVGNTVTVTVSLQSLDIGLPFLPLPDGGRITQVAQARIENVPSADLTC
jgi:Flp pilus assembly protein TadG